MMERSCSSSTGSEYQCNTSTCPICMAVPTNPVATACGHLFCWPCLYQWLQILIRPCPVCRTTLKWTKRYITPISIDGAASSSDGINGILQLPASTTPNSAGQFPSRKAVLDALDVMETANELLQKEQGLRFLRTRSMCLNILHANTDTSNPVQRFLGLKAETLYRENWERIKRERAERTKIAAHMAGLQRMVVWSNQYLPGWWTSGRPC